MPTGASGGQMPRTRFPRGSRMRDVSLDTVFESLYRRLGARYADAYMLFVLVANLLFVVPLGVVLLLSFWHPSVGETVRFVLGYQLAFALVAGPGSFLIARRVVPAAYRWVGGAHDPADAPAAWAAVVARLPHWVVATGAWYAIWSLPPTVYVGATLHFRWHGYPIYLIGLGCLVGVVCVFYYLLAEQYMRPVAREIADHLPEHFEPPGGLTLGAKALVLIPTINFFSAIVVGSLAHRRLGPELYLGEVVLLAVLVSVTLSLVLTLLFRLSVLRRIDDLRGAMRRVDRGDLDAHVPPLAGDELDDVGATFNEMVVGLRERESLREDNADLVADLQRQAGELRDSRARIVAAGDAARRRVERDLHDGAQQRLVLLGLKLGMTRRQIERDPEGAAAVIDELSEDLRLALGELRDLARGIYPAVLENEGLPAALREAAESAAIPTKLECDGTGRYPTEIEDAVYFCCLEALQNAGKHAGTTACATVKLEHRGSALAFEVSDDGQGFEPSDARAGTGVQNMSDRVGALGGTLRIDTAPGRGTTITGRVPLPAARLKE